MNQYQAKGGERIEIIASVRELAKQRGIKLENVNSNRRTGKQYIDGRNLRFYFPASAPTDKKFFTFIKEVEEKHNLKCDIIYYGLLSYSMNFTRA